MQMNPTNVLYTSSHEWIEADGDVRKMGVTDHAQEMLGDIVFVEMPEVGKVVKQGDELLTLESPKAAAEVYAPISGEVVEINEDLESSPDKINQSPYEDGWIVKIRPASVDEEAGDLMDAEAYEKKIEEE
ncbi:glycine cleavage system protein GcvH [bacterium]|nr:glycine cleavage system protein GcvH [bacterium]